MNDKNYKRKQNKKSLENFTKTIGQSHKNNELNSESCLLVLIENVSFKN